MTKDFTPKAPFPSYDDISTGKFLNVPLFSQNYVVYKLGRFEVLAVKTKDEYDDVIVMALNPDDDLKRLYHDLPIGSLLSEQDRAEIVRKYRVQDPFVLKRLEATWDPLTKK